MFADEDVRGAAYMIEYDKFVYNEDFHGSPQEKMVDRLLSFADLVCDLYAQELLSAHEMDFFNYEFVQIYKNPNVQHYLDYLKARYDRDGTRDRTRHQPFPPMSPIVRRSCARGGSRASACSTRWRSALKPWPRSAGARIEARHLHAAGG